MGLEWTRDGYGMWAPKADGSRHWQVGVNVELDDAWFFAVGCDERFPSLKAAKDWCEVEDAKLMPPVPMPGDGEVWSPADTFQLRRVFFDDGNNGVNYQRMTGERYRSSPADWQAWVREFGAVRIDVMDVPHHPPGQHQPGEVWGVPGDSRMWRRVDSSSVEWVEYSTFYPDRDVSPAEWGAWVRESGAVRLDGPREDVAALRKELESVKEGYHALDKNWETVHESAMRPIRKACGNSDLTVGEIVLVIQREHERAEKAEADLNASRVEVATLKAKLTKADEEVAAVIAYMPNDCVVHVREGGADEKLYATLATSALKMASKLKNAESSQQVAADAIADRDDLLRAEPVAVIEAAKDAGRKDGETVSKFICRLAKERDNLKRALHSSEHQELAKLRAANEIARKGLEEIENKLREPDPLICVVSWVRGRILATLTAMKAAEGVQP